MSHLLTWLTDNVRNAAAKCGARAASIYVPTPWNDAAPGLLVHVGAEPLPEMADLRQAADFAAQAEAQAAADAASADRTLEMRASQSADGCLIPIPMLAPHWRGASGDRGDTSSVVGAAGSVPQRRLADERQAPPIVGWLGLRFEEGPDPLYLPGGWQSLLELASALASTYVSFYGILTDPVTGLPGRAELQATLRAELERAQIMTRPVSLLLVQLRELEDVNQIAGRRTGDAVLREFIELLQRILRSSDVVMRYGGAIFALPLRDVAAPGAMVVAEKIHRSLQRHTFIERELRLTCAIGIAAMSVDEAAAPHQPHQPIQTLQPLDFLRRADQALAVSCKAAGHRPVVWRPDSDLASAEPLDPLLGVFTGQADKDYRNMRLLWEVLEVLGAGTSSDSGDAAAAAAELAEAVVVRVFSLFGAARVALFQPHPTEAAADAIPGASAAAPDLRLIAGRRQRTGDHEPVRLAASDLTPDEHELSARAFATGQPQFAAMDAAAWREPAAPLTALAQPLMVEGRRLGTLYLASRAAARKLEHGDLPVLTGVATHLALALDRAERAARNRLRAHREEARLRAEVQRLQQAVQHSKMVFRSQAMTSLLDTTSRVAATDATVLVTGESGTGKEMLAHALHSLSPRHHRPLVIVDCGAIPASLMDSELFGRERGAFTGAERRTPGRLAQAEGGTVFLDEIGELPLEVQAKLLRFVQERTVTMVGSTAVQSIDVRIIAATNRDLEDDVRSGRFREDLFHRLNVVRLRMPPLRERRDDIPLLARHFLDVFAMQYGKAVRAFTPEAEAALDAHAWAGNVRQLQNTILQAVVLASGERITAEDLRLPSVASSAMSSTSSSSTSSTASASSMPPMTRAPHAAHASEPARPRVVMPTDASAWQALTDSLRAELAATRGQAARPLGKWLGYEVVLQAYELAGGIMARAADRIGLSDTTFVRRLRQAQAESVNIRYPDSWSALRASLIDVLRMPPRADTRGEVLADRIDDLMLTLVINETPQAARAAALMGLSVPTIKRRMSEMGPRRVA